MEVKSNMATTSIWSVKGWLGKVVIYVENPEKTMNPNIATGDAMLFMKEQDVQGLSDVIAYAVNEEKTKFQNDDTKNGNQGADIGKKFIDGESRMLMQQYVSGVNCSPTTARNEMMAVKKRYGKETGIMAYHGYQSFAPGECTPALAHEIGVKLAEELWGNRFQVLVATHLDKESHLHNHFVVNTVSFTDGKCYHRTNKDYQQMRAASDRLCREYKLSVIENPGRGKAKHYGEWNAERNGKPTYRSIVRADVDEVIARAKTEKQFFYFLKEMGYTIKVGKDITLCMDGRERGLKLERNFGEEYTLQSIRKRILVQDKQSIPSVFPIVKKKINVRVCGSLCTKKKIGGLRGLYLHYSYLLGILPKKRKCLYSKRNHYLLREDLIKLKQILRETRLLCHYRIDTAEQLFSLKEDLQSKMAELEIVRKHLRYQCRSIKDNEKLSVIKSEITGLTKQVGEMRKEVALCDGIAVRSGVIKEKIKSVRDDKKGKEAKNYEHIRRGR